MRVLAVLAAVACGIGCAVQVFIIVAGQGQWWNGSLLVLQLGLIAVNTYTATRRVRS